MFRPLRSSLLVATATLALIVAGCTNEAPEEPEAGQEEESDAAESSDLDEEVGEEVEDEEIAVPTLVPTGGAGLEGDVGNVTLADVLGDDLGWVTVGSSSEPGDRPSAVFASSEDGVSWEVDELPAPEGSEHRASKVARVDGTTVIVGATKAGSNHHLVLWVGEPGDWEVRELEEEAGSARALGINGAAVTDDDTVLVVGSTTDEDGTSTPQTWRIALDGTVEHAAPFDGPGLLRDVAVVEGGLIAVGHAGADEAHPPPAVLRSEDGGVTWESLGTAGLEDASLLSIQEIDGRLFIGGMIDDLGTGHSAIWGSSDGETWESLLSDGNRGSSLTNRVHRFGGELIGLGTWLEQTEPGTDSFVYWHWPGAGDRGHFGTSAQHDGRIVAIGAREGFPTGLLTATDVDSWQAIDLAAQVLENVTGVAGWSIRDIAASTDNFVVVGSETEITASRVNERLFAGRPPDFENPASGLDRQAAIFTSVLFHEDHGWIASGNDTSEPGWWDGTRAAVSEDGEEWTEVPVDASTADRVLEILATDDRILAFGLGWVDGRPESTIWELTDDGFVPVTVEGLGEWVPLNGCANGDNVILHTYRGGAARALVVSTDGGHTFDVVEDGPFPNDHGFRCDIDDEGRALIVIHRTADNEVHRFDVAGRDWTELPAATEGSRVDVTRPVWIADLGWFVLGSRVEVEDSEPLVRRSIDLETWEDLAFEGDPTRASATLLAATDDDLIVYGRVNDVPEFWTLPRAELE